SSSPERLTTSPTASRSWHAIRSYARAWARRDGNASSRATPSSGWSTTSTGSTASCSVRKACEDAEGGLPLAGRGQETGLPPDRDVRVVAEDEPDHQVD